MSEGKPLTPRELNAILPCTKKPYASLFEAELAMALMKNVKKRKESRAYLCGFCGQYHLTSRKYFNSRVKEGA